MIYKLHKSFPQRHLILCHTIDLHHSKRHSITSVSLLQDVHRDGTECAAIQVLAAVLDHPLGVRAADRERVPLGAPRAVPIDMANNLLGGHVNEVKRARGALCRVGSAAGVDPELLVRLHHLSLDGTLVDLGVLVTCRVAHISGMSRQEKATREIPSAWSFPQEGLRFLIENFAAPTLRMMMMTHWA